MIGYDSRGMIQWIKPELDHMSVYSSHMAEEDTAIGIINRIIPARVLEYEFLYSPEYRIPDRIMKYYDDLVDFDIRCGRSFDSIEIEYAGESSAWLISALPQVFFSNEKIATFHRSGGWVDAVKTAADAMGKDLVVYGPDRTTEAGSIKDSYEKRYNYVTPDLPVSNSMYFTYAGYEIINRCGHIDAGKIAVSGDSTGYLASGIMSVFLPQVKETSLRLNGNDAFIVSRRKILGDSISVTSVDYGNDYFLLQPVMISMAMDHRLMASRSLPENRSEIILYGYFQP